MYFRFRQNLTFLCGYPKSFSRFETKAGQRYGFRQSYSLFWFKMTNAINKLIGWQLFIEVVSGFKLTQSTIKLRQLHILEGLLVAGFKFNLMNMRQKYYLLLPTIDKEGWPGTDHQLSLPKPIILLRNTGQETMIEMVLMFKKRFTLSLLLNIIFILYQNSSKNNKNSSCEVDILIYHTKQYREGLRKKRS